jgi:hypothetical protein
MVQNRNAVETTADSGDRLQATTTPKDCSEACRQEVYASADTRVRDAAPQTQDTKLVDAQQKLTDATSGRLGENQQQFSRDLQTFLKRTDVSDADKAKTLDAITDIVTNNRDGSRRDSGLSDAERKTVAAGLMNNAARPQDIDQGFHNTCNVTTIEEGLFSENPASAAAKVKQIALYGQYTGRDGKTINVPPDALHADREAAGSQDKDGQRNYASQLLQMGMINHYLQPRGQYYTQVQSTDRRDTGERLMAMGPGGEFSPRAVLDPATGKEMRHPDLDAYKVGEIGKQAGIDGQFVFAHTSFARNGDNGSVKTFGSSQELEAAMKNRKWGILVVNSGDKLFTGTSGKGGAGGGHVVSLHNNGDGTFKLSNQWGKDHDQDGLTANNLMQATLKYADGRNPGPGGRPVSPEDPDRNAKWEKWHNANEGLERDGIVTLDKNGQKIIDNKKDEAEQQKDEKQPEKDDKRKAENSDGNRTKLASLHAKQSDARAKMNDARAQKDLDTMASLDELLRGYKRDEESLS